MNEFQVGSIQLVHTDSRRTIFEFNGENFSFQKFVFTGDSKPTGNHYHERKIEIFFIVEGGGTVALCHVDHSDQKEVFKITAGTVIYIEERVAHTFWLTPGTIKINFSSAPFDENDQDLIPFNLTLD